jgi:hypothetical protein
MDPRILYSLESALIFFILASPFMYSLTAPITKKIKGGAYVPVAVHALVFGIVVYVLMHLQK